MPWTRVWCWLTEGLGHCPEYSFQQAMPHWHSAQANRNPNFAHFSQLLIRQAWTQQTMVLLIIAIISFGLGSANLGREASVNPWNAEVSRHWRTCPIWSQILHFSFFNFNFLHSESWSCIVVSRPTDDWLQTPPWFRGCESILYNPQICLFYHSGGGKGSYCALPEINKGPIVS